MIKKSLDYKNFIKPLFLNKSRLKSLDSKLHEILKLLPKLIKSKNETLNVLDKNSEEELNKIIQLIKVREYGRSKIIFGTFI